jgi:hypothetical protein
MRERLQGSTASRDLGLAESGRYGSSRTGTKSQNSEAPGAAGRACHDRDFDFEQSGLRKESG